LDVIVRNVGTLNKTQSAWVLEAEPHVLMMAKRIFKKVEATSNRVITIPATPEVARDLEWFSLRYPLEIPEIDNLKSQAATYVEAILRRDELLTGKFKPRTFKLALPARDYQSEAAEVMLSKKAMILGDQVGLGKTCTSLCVIAQRECQPAVIVCLTHLAEQWKREVNRFLPKLSVHVVKKQIPYNVNNRKGEWPAVLIISYSKLRYWADVISENCKCVIFDEIQEIRRHDSLKHQAAVKIASNMEYRFGLTGSPVYNYGGEFYNVFKAINPDALGSQDEFLREWCDGIGMSAKPKLSNAAAFGSWLRENHLMLRRTRADVSRELPPLTRITHFVEPDAEEFKKSDDRARELARILLQSSEKGAQFRAAGEFDALMRQTTGISKAVAVASFVDMLLRSGEPVVLFGWHRSVYEIWLSQLAAYKPSMYTGSESPAKKNSELKRFTDGETDLLIMSLRSGVGVDGLQHRCKTVVIGEFDWSPAVIEQNIGRVCRDGQKDPVMAYSLAIDSGADPFMMEVLGLKADQVAGIRGESAFLDKKPDAMALMKKLARTFLDKNA
jgi:SNF2 family DNA or RNA helicase